MNNRKVHFRVLMDYEDDVFRDIEIHLNDSFLKLHEIIQEAFGFDNSQMASFYVSNEDWEKGQEITLMDVGEPAEQAGEPIWLMHETTLDKIIFEKGQKLLYVFDFMLLWCFYIDVINITAYDQNIILPRITQRYGTPPRQYDKSPDITFDGHEMEDIQMDADDIENEDIEQIFRMLGTDSDPDEEGYRP